jgi:hypothetical protein
MSATVLAIRPSLTPCWSGSTRSERSGERSIAVDEIGHRRGGGFADSAGDVAGRGMDGWRELYEGIAV